MPGGGFVRSVGTLLLSLISVSIPATMLLMAFPVIDLTRFRAVNCGLKETREHVETTYRTIGQCELQLASSYLTRTKHERITVFFVFASLAIRVGAPTNNTASVFSM
jgi:hypothetical protein